MKCSGSASYHHCYILFSPVRLLKDNSGLAWLGWGGRLVCGALFEGVPGNVLEAFGFPRYVPSLFAGGGPGGGGMHDESG